MKEYIPFIAGTEVRFRNIKWEIVSSSSSGDQMLYRLRGQEGIFYGKEIEMLYPLEEIVPEEIEIDPRKTSPLQYWLLYHQAFLLEQAFGDSTILSLQPILMGFEMKSMTYLQRRRIIV